MENNLTKPFQFNYKQIIKDEIALGGLEGIGVDFLWQRVAKRISTLVTDKMIARFWLFIVNCKTVSVYQLPEPQPRVNVVDRFNIIDEESGQIKDPDDYLDGPYEYHPVENEYGSCKYYKTRVLIPDEYLKRITYDQVMAEYKDTLTLVATIEERWQALAPHKPIFYLNLMSPVHFCLLESVGRGRENGQMTVGTSNLTKIVKESKLLFYNRKVLQEMDLVRVQYITQVMNGRGVKSLLLRLKKFHQPSVLSMPKTGMLHDIVEYLLKQPDYSEKTDVLIKNGMLTQPKAKRLQKTVNIFNFEERMVPSEQIVKSKKQNGMTKKKFICLSSVSDESSQSEDESSDTTLTCEYTVGVNLLRQAYERLLDAGLKGLTQVEIGQLLGVEFYTSRTICKILKTKKIVREILEDRGKQRTAKYIAVAATGKIDAKYAEEMKKFLDHMDENKSINQENKSINDKNNSEINEKVDENQSTSVEMQSSFEPPQKRIKLENDNNTVSENVGINMITEIKVLDGYENFNRSLLSSKKCLTLRQLRFANGLLRVIKERMAVSGYQTLSGLVSKETDEPPMDTKALKSFIQKLVADKQLKIYKLKWPDSQQKYSVVICAPHVKATHPIIKAKYKEINIRVMRSNKTKIETEAIEYNPKILYHFAQPRYIKIQKLHEFIMEFVYFANNQTDSDNLPQGFVALVDIFPEITLELALMNCNSSNVLKVAKVKINESMLGLKLRDSPQDLYRILIQSSSFHNSIRLNLKVLAMFGLIQLVYDPPAPPVDYNNTLANYIFFVNRHAKIINTTGTWPNPKANIAELEKSYYFSSLEDVKAYWKAVSSVSTATTIKLPSRQKKKLRPPIRMVSEVQSYDNGERHGDGLGPCGFDSCFYLELPRLWRSLYIAPSEPQKRVKKKIQIKIPKAETNKQKNKIKKKTTKKPTVEKVIRRKFIRKSASDTTVTWTKEEDRIIMICKTAITIMSPSSQPGSLRLRNLTAKDLLHLNDPKKISSVCHRRAITLDSNSTLNHEMECILAELRRRRYLIQKYEGLLKKLRICYLTNMRRFINEARMPMFELVWIICELIHSQAFTQRLPCVAMSLEEFHDNFIIIPATSNKLYNLYKAPENIALKEAILLVIMLSFNNDYKIDNSKKIYSIFKLYPENALRSAVEQLRKGGAIAAKEKILNNLMHRLNLEDVSQSAYKISALYQRKWISKLNTEFVDNVADSLTVNPSKNNIKGSPDINCITCELQSCNILEVASTTIPVITSLEGSLMPDDQLNVIDIETKFKFKSGTMNWKYKTNIENFSELYEDVDYDEVMNWCLRNAMVYCNDDTVFDMEDAIISHLNTKQEEGSTYSELQEICDYDSKTLTQKLAEFESKSIIKRVCHYENRIVLTKFVKPWSIKLSNQKYIIPVPWGTLDTKLRYEIFFKWAGVIMNKIFECPGCSVSFLSDSCELLSTRAVQDICMLLEKCKCIILNIVRAPHVDLFSDDEVIPEPSEFNEYESVDNIIATPMKNCFTRYAYVRRVMLDKYYVEMNSYM